MKKILLLLVGLFVFSGGIIKSDEVLTDLIWILNNHRDSEARKNAAASLGTLKIKSAIKPLIDALADENEDVRIASHKSLVKLTKQNLPLEQGPWSDWWNKVGSQSYENVSSSSQELARLKSYLNFAFIVMLLELAFIILFIVVFSFMGGAKIKEMKEINRRAERYIADADGVSKRFEELFEEIEHKRNDMNLFFNKLREDNQNEIERFSDLMQQNIEHNLREANRSLREKSESELKQTLSLLKEDLERLVKKTVDEQMEKTSQQMRQNKNISA
jgi:F0F1-type ATP synthase membrane subunit b/b'